ncbi:MAG: AMP-binding protein [Paludibacteraceae bacterium]|nr:AMP-binding protein [Paludibacteraceae bacterium]
MKQPYSDIEFQSPEEIKRLQEHLLGKQLDYLQQHSPFYRALFAKQSIVAADIRTLEDLRSVPFTTKTDLQQRNADFLCVDRTRIVDYITTSGTLGDPVTFACTDGDLERLAYNEAVSFRCAGIEPGDRVQLMVTLDKRFMAGMAYFLGLRKLGAGAIRVGNGIPELQWDTIRRLQPDTLMCIPSFILRLIEYAEAHGIDYRHSSVKRIIGIGEGMRDIHFELNSLGRKIKEKWDVDLFATYSSTEMSATFSECAYSCGGHLHPELLIAEIIGEDGAPVAPGEVGEVVITTLGVEGMPLLRFKTGDMAAMFYDQCRCGRWSPRISPIVGRKNHMIKYKGTTLYPPALTDVLNNTDYVENYFITVSTTDNETDNVVITVGLRQQTAFDAIKDLKDRFRTRVRVAPEIATLPVDVIHQITHPAMSRKPVTLFDNRAK